MAPVVGLCEHGKGTGHVNVRKVSGLTDIKKYAPWNGDSYIFKHPGTPSSGKGKGKFHPTTGHKSPEGESRYSSTLSLTSALDGVGGQRHAPAALPPGKGSGTHCIVGLVGPRADLDRCGISRLQRDSIPGPSSP